MTASSSSSSSSTSASNNKKQAEWWIGQRVVDEEGNRATVRYLGPVATAKDPEALWIGKQRWDGMKKNAVPIMKCPHLCLLRFWFNRCRMGLSFTW